MNRYQKESRFLHGGDYNPDQWLDQPEVLEQDLVFMQDTGSNTVSIGMFSWVTLEPEEGKYNFEWMDKIFDDIEKIGGNVILSTPSGARPAWMSQKYPEVLRTNARREKMLHGARHNHCFSSPVYREKIQEMNQKLAERYGKHPALLMWHISNEYSGECHCDFCQTAFRNWLKEKYVTLDKLNKSWWTTFWSHTYTNWEQIESPSPIGESMVHGHNLDWKRFVTDQTIDFYQTEIKPLRALTPNIPITTNFMASSDDMLPFRLLDYSKFSEHVDVISWDSYPPWHSDRETTADLASKVGFINDLYRSLKQKPFMIMESTPSAVNWHAINKAKRPGMHLLSSLQYLAHGADSNLYFQWRQSRGSSEKFHGAVVGHDSSTENRVYKEVKEVGRTFEQIKEIKGTNKEAKVAILYDWESNWALDDAQGFVKNAKLYPQTLQAHYRHFWNQDIMVDVVTPKQDFKKYDLLIAPMLYMVTEETMTKLQDFVSKGGTLVSSYLTGLVDENDLTYLNGWPKQLQEVFGLTVKEIDTLYPNDRNSFQYNQQTFESFDYASIVEPLGCDVLSTYETEFYADTPVVTRNHYDEGEAYYIGARTDVPFLESFYDQLCEELGLKNPLIKKGHKDVSVQVRNDAEHDYYFIMNFSEKERQVTLGKPAFNLISQEEIAGELNLPPYDVVVVKVKTE